MIPNKNKKKSTRRTSRTDTPTPPPGGGQEELTGAPRQTVAGTPLLQTAVAGAPAPPPPPPGGSTTQLTGVPKQTVTGTPLLRRAAAGAPPPPPPPPGGGTVTGSLLPKQRVPVTPLTAPAVGGASLVGNPGGGMLTAPAIGGARQVGSPGGGLLTAPAVGGARQVGNPGAGMLTAPAVAGAQHVETDAGFLDRILRLIPPADGPTDAERHRRQARANLSVLKSIFNSCFDPNGFRRQIGERPDLYDSATGGVTPYAQTPLTVLQFSDFLTMTGLANQTVHSQLVDAYQNEMEQYRRDVADRITALTKLLNGRRLTQRERRLLNEELEAPDDSVTTPEEALADRGDYFHVMNGNFTHQAHRARRERRIIINVNSQAAGLRISQALCQLSNDPVIGPFIAQHKVWLSTANPADLKHDKLVVYYVRPDSLDGSDQVGDAIAAAVLGARNDDEVDERFGPFYSIIAPGIAWAEEPGAYVDEFAAFSFSQSRINLITKIVEANPEFQSQAQFINFVLQSMANQNIDPDSPHRHLGGGNDTPPGSPRAPRRQPFQ